MYYIYILRLNNGQLYCGMTKSINRRLKEHTRGSSPFTKKQLPVQLLHYEAYINKKDAEKRERYFKTTKGKSSLRAMLKNTLDQ